MKSAKNFGALASFCYRVSEMRDGYRPEVYGPGDDDILFMEPASTIKEASKLARSEAEERRRIWLADQVEQLNKRPLAKYTQLGPIEAVA